MPIMSSTGMFIVMTRKLCLCKHEQGDEHFIRVGDISLKIFLNFGL